MMSIRPNFTQAVSAMALCAALCACSAANDDPGVFTTPENDRGADEDSATPPDPQPYPAWSTSGTADDGLKAHDPAKGYTPDTISIVPQASLAANTKYRVDIKATVGGDASSVLTSFTTGDRSK